VPALSPGLPRVAALLLVVALGLAGCTGGGEPGGGPAGDVTGAADGSTVAGPKDIPDRCLSATPEGRDIEGVTITGGAMRLRGALLRAAEPSGTAVVLLPQIGGAGLCGWLPYAALLTDRGVTALSIDPCGYGDSDCPRRLNPAIDAQVRLAMRYLADTVHPDRVVLAGASMGGSQTVRAVAHGVEVDAWVDVSGPGAWDGEVLLDLADRVPETGLVVFARSDGAALFRDARRLARRTGAEFLRSPPGHGWELLLTLRGRMTPVGERVAAFVCGDAG
jgi:pimeloyl-ACP methyl ester carboxylesterase